VYQQTSSGVCPLFQADSWGKLFPATPGTRRRRRLHGRLWRCCSGSFLLVTEFFLFVNTGPAFTIIANVTHPALRPTAYAWNILVMHLLGDALSPPLVGALADHCHGSLLPGFVAAAAFLLLGSLFWLWGALYLHRDMLAAPTSLDEVPGKR